MKMSKSGTGLVVEPVKCNDCGKVATEIKGWTFDIKNNHKRCNETINY